MKTINKIILVLTLLLVVGCSEVPDETNPTYHIILSSGEHLITNQFSVCDSEPNMGTILVNCYESSWDPSLQVGITHTYIATEVWEE